MAFVELTEEYSVAVEKRENEEKEDFSSQVPCWVGTGDAKCCVQRRQIFCQLSYKVIHQSPVILSVQSS